MADRWFLNGFHKAGCHQDTCFSTYHKIVDGRCEWCGRSEIKQVERYKADVRRLQLERDTLDCTRREGGDSRHCGLRAKCLRCRLEAEVAQLRQEQEKATTRNQELTRGILDYLWTEVTGDAEGAYEHLKALVRPIVRASLPVQEIPHEG